MSNRFLALADLHDPPENVYRDDPVRWVQERLNEELWSKQAAIMGAVATNRRVAVQSCHDVGKSFCVARLAAWWLDTHPQGEAFVVTCYTEGTEILTREGWKLLEDVKAGLDGDEFATRNPKTQAFEWQHATQYYESDWDGEVVDFHRKNQLYLQVTPNHRMLVRWQARNKKTGVQESGELLKPAGKIRVGGHKPAIPVTSEWHGKSPETIRFGRYEWPTRDFAAFLGAWLAEGSLGTPAKNNPTGKAKRAYTMRTRQPSLGYGGPIVVTQLPGTKGCEPYRALFRRLLGREPVHHGDKSFQFNCVELWRWLQPFKGAANKHVPVEVKDWAKEDLEALLEFYLLGDGHRHGPGWASTTVSKQLADDLQEIAQKVGLSASITIRQPRDAEIDGRTILAANCRPTYELRFLRAQTHTVTPTRSHYTGKVRCVSVPNEVIFVRRPNRITVPAWCGNTAPTFPQVRAILWREIGRAHRKGNLPGRVNQTEWWIGNEIVGFGRKPSDYDESAFQGIHDRYVLVIVDEGCGVPESLYTAAGALVTNDDSRIVAVGNPDDPLSHFARICQPGSGWFPIKISAYDSPNFTDERVSSDLKKVLVSQAYLDDLIADGCGPGTSIWTSKVLGEFPEESEDSVVSPAAVAKCRRPEQVHESLEPVELGVDVGAGGDFSVIIGRRGPKAFPVARRKTPDTMTLVGMCLEAINSTGATKIKVDKTGVGQGVTDRLQELKNEGKHHATVVGVMVGAASTRPLRFPKLRDQIWWEVGRLMSEQGRWDLSEMDDSAVAQLCAPRWAPDSSGRIKVERKDDTKKRIGRSPDDADSLLLCFMQPMSSGQEWLDSLVTRCPECGEIQQPGALKCHQCQAELPAPAPGPMVGAPNEENAKLGFQRNDLGIWDIPR